MSRNCTHNKTSNPEPAKRASAGGGRVCNSTTASRLLGPGALWKSGERPQDNLPKCGSPRKLRFLFRRAGLSLVVLTLTMTFCVEAKAQASSEYQVKAAFLYNFAKFIEWPADAFSSNTDPLVIGVIGDDPFGGALDQTISGKSISGRPLVVHHLRWGQDLRACHILYISSSEGRRVPQIIQSVKGASVLTIADTDHFNQQGGIINFILEANKVRFEINVRGAEHARLRISSKLLALSRNR